MTILKQDKQILEINAAIKCIQEFVNTDTSKITAQELFDRANFLIKTFKNTLKNIKDRKRIIKDENVGNFETIDVYFKNLNLPKPYIIIERLNSSQFESYIENYDHILIGKGYTIKESIGNLKSKCQIFYTKHKTAIIDNNIIRNLK